MTDWSIVLRNVK